FTEPCTGRDQLPHRTGRSGLTPHCSGPQLNRARGRQQYAARAHAEQTSRTLPVRYTITMLFLAAPWRAVGPFLSSRLHTEPAVFLPQRMQYTVIRNRLQSVFLVWWRASALLVAF